MEEAGVAKLQSPRGGPDGQPIESAHLVNPIIKLVIVRQELFSADQHSGLFNFANRVLVDSPFDRAISSVHSLF
jgi:hypothetical protein